MSPGLGRCLVNLEDRAPIPERIKGNLVTEKTLQHRWSAVVQELILTILWANSADCKLTLFFLFFLENRISSPQRKKSVTPLKYIRSY